MERIFIENFQSLREVEIDFSEASYICLVGPSDTGKSAVIRSVKALIENPRGQSQIKHGSMESRIFIGGLDGLGSVGRKKGESASYRWSDGPTLQDFEKVRPNEMPEEISQLLRLGPIKAGDLSVYPNIHSQHDMPWLVADSAPHRAKVLGELSGANSVAVAAKDAEADARKIGPVLEDERERLHRLRLELEEYEGVEHALEHAEKADRAFKEADACRALAAQVEARHKALSAVEERRKRLGDFVETRVVVLNKIESLVNKIDTLYYTSEKVRQAWEVWHTSQERKKRLDDATASRLIRKGELYRQLKTCPTCGQKLTEALKLEITSNK